MRILHLYSGNLFGGVETLLVLLARDRRLCSAMEPVFGLCFRGRLAGELDAVGAVVHQLGGARVSRPLTVLRARRALRRLVDAERFDAVVSHSSWVNGVFGPVLRRGRPPLVQWLHNPLTDSWVDRWGHRTRPRMVLCNSQYTAATATSRFSRSTIRWMYAPVRVTVPAPDPAARAALRRDVDTSSDAVVILQASRMQAWKGHQVHLEALSRLREAPHWVSWFVGGAQRPCEVRYLAELRALALRLGIADRVRFLGERHDVDQVMAAADIYCQPNTEPEPFGIVFVEALAAGVPVIASDVGGPSEVVDPSCGLLVPPGDIAALVRALGRLVDDRALRHTLGAHGPGRARSLCHPATQLGRLSELLGQVVESHP